MSKYDLREVHDDENAKVDIVFLHGLGEDIEGTWTKKGVYWPKDLLSEDVSDSRIFLFGYDSTIHDDPSWFSKIEIVASQLCDLLADKRSGIEMAGRPIIFIAHSLGGLVAAQILVGGQMALKDSPENSIAKSLRGLVFLGTPFRDSMKASLAETTGRILNLFRIGTEQTTPSLGFDFKPLNELMHKFAQVLQARHMSKAPEDRVIVFFFYETHKTQSGLVLSQIVEKDSAWLPFYGEAVSIAADHLNICKFEDRYDANYEVVIGAIRRVIETIRIVMSPPDVVPYLVPPSSITINGIPLDQSTKPATDASNTNYILVQSKARLSPSQRRELTNMSLVLHDYVSKNTYLYGYQDVDLDRIRQMDPIVYVDVYRMEFKTPQSLKGAVLDQLYKVHVVFHKDVDSTSASLRNRVSLKSHLDADDIELFPRKARLTVLGRYLNAIVTIDEVHHIEAIGETKLRNDRACQILGANIASGPGLAQQHAYRGEGQVIAIADTGLDTGHGGPDHHAFGDRVLAHFPINRSAADHDGHGTHVCGSAVGDGWMTDHNGHRHHLLGTAPKARLVVQCLSNGLGGVDDLNIPGDLTQLFDLPYRTHGARVHSNSWGFRMEDGEQLEYGRANRANDIDEFVWNNPDMVICWAAGNDAADLDCTGNVGLGHIGSEAAAKNCITVGASENNRPNATDTYGQIYPDNFPANSEINPLPEAQDPLRVAYFSSRGPTVEGRPKPDVVAPGTGVLSVNSTHVQNPDRDGPDQYFCYMSGTSMATPLVAGCAAVLREALIKNGSRFPSAALIKALLINGARILAQQPTPSFESGFGLVNLADSIAIVCGDYGIAFCEAAFSGGSDDDKFSVQTAVQTAVEPGHTALRVTLVWSDFPGPMIRNSLRLEVQHSNGAICRGYNADDDEDINNVQQVLWQDIPEGLVTIIVKLYDIQEPPQPFALVWRSYVVD